jgi:hypothetical protein
MKKIIYIALLALACATTFTSCTDEEVTPKTELDNGGGAANDPIVKG